MTSPAAWQRAVRRGLLAVVGGVLLWAGHPPLDWGWTGLVSLVPLLLLARDLAAGPRPLRAAFGHGLLAGATTFGLLLYWLIPFGYVAYVLLGLVQALYTAAFVVLVTAWGARRGRAVVATASWVALEALRAGWPLGGFSWGAIAYTQHDGGLLLPVARVLGAHGVTLVAVAVAVAVEAALVRGWRALARSGATSGAGWRAATGTLARAVALPVAVLMGLLGGAALVRIDPPAPSGRTVDIAAVQASDTRATSASGVTRLDSDRIVRVAELMLQATQPLAADPPDLTVWPENALDTDIRTERGADVRERLDAAVALLDGGPLLAGEYITGPRPRTLYNRMTVYTADGEGDAYVKRVPVPFGEYVPFRRWLDWFPPLEQLPNDTLPGEAAQVLDVAGARVGAVICFENTFGSLVRDQVLEGADVLVVSTNNTSFGLTPMSRQHVAFSQLRAVETGRWVVHAGLSGISGLIDPTGAMTQTTQLFQQDLVRADVPLVEGMTPAMVVGNAVGWVATAVVLAALVVLAVQRWRRRDGRPAGDGGEAPERRRQQTRAPAAAGEV